MSWCVNLSRTEISPRFPIVPAFLYNESLNAVSNPVSLSNEWCTRSLSISIPLVVSKLFTSSATITISSPKPLGDKQETNVPVVFTLTQTPSPVSDENVYCWNAKSFPVTFTLNPMNVVLVIVNGDGSVKLKTIDSPNCGSLRYVFGVVDKSKASDSAIVIMSFTVVETIVTFSNITADILPDVTAPPKFTHNDLILTGG